MTSLWMVQTLKKYLITLKATFPFNIWKSSILNIRNFKENKLIDSQFFENIINLNFAEYIRSDRFFYIN